MISEWQWIGKDLVGSGHGLIIRYYFGISLDGLRKTAKNISQNSQSPGPRIETGTSRTWSRSEISSSHGGEYDVRSCLLGCTLMMEAVRTSETSVDNHFTRQYNPEDSSEHHEVGVLTTRPRRLVSEHKACKRGHSSPDYISLNRKVFKQQEDNDIQPVR
jgi:hypothetical protein